MNALITLRCSINRLVRSENGASAVEYAILVALIGAAVGVAVSAFDLSTIFADVSGNVQTLINAPAAQ